MWQRSVTPIGSGSYVWKTRKSRGGRASQRGSPRSWFRLEGLGSGGEANFFHLAEQRPE